MIIGGLLDWAERVPGPVHKVNAGTNPVFGIIAHSAEGYEAGLRSQILGGPVSWHLSNLKDGRLWQHYPLTSRCWHATAANNAYIGIESEGRAGESLTEAQIANLVRIIREVSAWKGWEPRRPTSDIDMSATLYEHREVTRFGGTATACPSGRIPWDEILSRLQEDDVKENYDGELNSRRAREQLIFWLMNNSLKSDFDENQKIRIWTDQDALVGTVPFDVPDYAKPT